MKILGAKRLSTTTNFIPLVDNEILKKKMPFSIRDFNLHICVSHQVTHKGRCHECAKHFKILKLEKLEKLALKSLKEWEEKERLEAREAAELLMLLNEEADIQERFPTIVSALRQRSIAPRLPTSTDNIWMHPFEWATDQLTKLRKINFNGYR